MWHGRSPRWTPEPETLREARRRWAELLRRIFEVDPLACPRCGTEMRIVAFITDPTTIDRILEHLRRSAPTRTAQAVDIADQVVYLAHRDGLITGYGHLSEILVAQGDTVEQGRCSGGSVRPDA